MPLPEGLDLKHIMGQHWIDPPKRERKRVHNYSEAEYFKNALKSNKGERSAGPRLPKMPQLQVGPLCLSVAGMTSLALLHCLPYA